MDDLCVMQPLQWYRGEFVQAMENSTFVGRARFSFNLCPGSRASVHVNEHDSARGIEAQLFAFATRTYVVGLTFPITSSPARPVYRNTGADPLWIMVLVTTMGDNIPSDASVDVKVHLYGDLDCAPENFATTTMPDTTATPAANDSAMTTLVCPMLNYWLHQEKNIPEAAPISPL